jgi:hypothetical protein
LAEACGAPCPGAAISAARQTAAVNRFFIVYSDPVEPDAEASGSEGDD